MKRNKLLTLFAAVLMLLGVQNAKAVTLQVVDGSNGGSIARLVDGDTGSKWEGGFGNGCFVILKNAANLPIIPGSYTIVTGNDNASWNGRGWKAWKIYGANFAYDAAADRNSEAWKLLDEKSNITHEIVPDVNSTPFDFNFSEAITEGYVYFKIEITELQGASYMQMCEFILNNCTVDDSVVNDLKGYDLTGVDEDLVNSYNAALQAYVDAAEDAAAAEAALATMATLRQKIEGINNGMFIALDWAVGAWGDGPGSNLVDKKEGTKWGGNFQGSDPQYVIFRGKPMQPFFYKLVTGNDTASNTGRNWKTWKVFGGNFASEAEATKDAEGWVVLDSRENISEEYLPMKNFYPATFDFNQGVNEAYSYYKVEVYAPHSGTQQQMSEMYLCTQEEFEAIREPLVAEFEAFAAGLADLVVEAECEADKTAFAELYTELQTTADAVRLTKVYNELVALREALQDSAAFVAGNCYRCLDGNTAWGDNENWTKLVDGDINTKWGGGMPEGGSYVIFKAYQAKACNQYMLVTGNDTKNSPGRNWKSWKIYGANIKGNMDNLATRDFGSWTLIDEKTDIGQDRLPADNFTYAFFNFTNPKSFKYYKIEVEAPCGGDAIQMSEFKMLTDEDYAALRGVYVASLTTVAEGLANLGEGLDLPAGVVEQLIGELTTTVSGKIEAVATATADELLPLYNDAMNFISVEVPGRVADLVAAYTLTEIDGVYQINTTEQMISFANLVNSGQNEVKAVLNTDVDLSRVITNDSWTSIGNNSVPFKGEFDGQGFTIGGITYTATGQYNGLFGKLSTGAVVKNFTAEGTMTVSAGVTGRAVALIAAAGDGGVFIQNINSKMNYKNQLAGAQVGGVLGGALNGNATVVDRCTYSGELDGNDAGGNGNYGGLVGYANNNAACFLTISNCLFDGSLINSAATPGNCTFGGMIGYSNGANVTIKNVLSIGTVTSPVSAQFFGAVKSTRSSIHNSYYKGEKVNGSASTVTLNPQDATEVTDEQLANGEVAVKLGSAFRQDIGADAYPTLDTTKGVVAEITDAGYATLYVTETGLAVPEGVAAFTGAVDGNYVILNPIEGNIAPEEPVVLKGAAGIYSFAPALSAIKAEVNDLKGAANDIQAAGKYVLAKVDGKVGFFKADSGIIKAGKAYLELESGVKAFYFADDDATGISSVENVQIENGAIYNLAGQRLSKMQKGINIVGNKKILK